MEILLVNYQIMSRLPAGVGNVHADHHAVGMMEHICGGPMQATMEYTLSVYGTEQKRAMLGMSLVTYAVRMVLFK